MESHYGLIELLLVFGLVLGVLGWQLVSVRRAMRRDAAAADEGVEGAPRTSVRGAADDDVAPG